MDRYQIAQMACVYAELARVFGMQAENMKRNQRGESIVYTEDAFNASASRLESLSIKILNGD